MLNPYETTDDEPRDNTWRIMFWCGMMIPAMVPHAIYFVLLATRGFRPTAAWLWAFITLLPVVGLVWMMQIRLEKLMEFEDSERDESDEFSPFDTSPRAERDAAAAASFDAWARETLGEGTDDFRDLAREIWKTAFSQGSAFEVQKLLKGE